MAFFCWPYDGETGVALPFLRACLLTFPPVGGSRGRRPREPKSLGDDPSLGVIGGTEHPRGRAKGRRSRKRCDRDASFAMLSSAEAGLIIAIPEDLASDADKYH